MTRRSARWAGRLSRDSVLFVAGLAGFAHEVLAGSGDRSTLLLICAAMMGLPVFLRADEKRQESAKDGDS